MSAPADIIAHLRVAEQDGTKSEKRLASLVLREPDFVAKAAISEIAIRADVSEPTVTRFCRNLGCNGMRDFKILLAKAIAIGGQYLTAEPLDRDMREQRIAQTISDSAILAIQRTANALDVGVIVDVAEKIAAAGNVLCIGSGGISSMMATEMQNRLFRLGVPVVAQVDGQLQRMYAATASSSTFVIAFSVSGFAKSITDAVEVARQYGATTAAVTVPDSRLAKVAHSVIRYVPVEDGSLYKPTSSRFALLAIVDMIAMTVGEVRGPKVLEGLRRIKQSVNVYKIEDPSLPLGD